MCWPDVDVFIFLIGWTVPQIRLKKLLKVLTQGNKGYQFLIPLNQLEVKALSLRANGSLVQDISRYDSVLERLIAPKASIDMVRRHGVEEFHGTSLEESDRAEFWLERLQRVIEEVRCPFEQRVACVVLLLHSEAYDWWKLVLKHPRFSDPMPWDFFV